MTTSLSPKVLRSIIYIHILILGCQSLSFAQMCPTNLVWTNYIGSLIPNDLNYSTIQLEPISIGEQNIVIENRNTSGVESTFNNAIFSGAIGAISNVYVLSINGSRSDAVTQKTKFQQTVYDLSFSILDIDRNQDGNWQDLVQLNVYTGSTKYDINSSNIVNQGTAVSFDDDSDTFLGTFEVDNATNDVGNVALHFPGAVDSVIINYTYGPKSSDNLGVQVVALSNLSFNSVANCIGPEVEDIDACVEYQTTDNEVNVLESISMGSTLVNTSTLKIITGPSNGTASKVLENATIMYSPSDGFSGIDSIKYLICDNNLLCDSATINIIVNSAEKSILTRDDHYPLLARSSTSGNVLTNDSNLENGNIIVQTGLTQTTSNGHFVLDQTGFFTYTPDEDFEGIDAAQYTICHDISTSMCRDGSIYFYVTKIVAPDTFSTVDFYDEVVTYQNVNYNGSVASNIGFIGGSNPEFTYALRDRPTNGTATLSIDGDLIYVPNSNYSGSDFLSYERQNSENSITETVNVNVNVIADFTNCSFSLITADDDFGFTCENQSASGSVIENDTYNAPEESTATVSLVSGVANGTLLLNGSGSYVYYPNTDYFGTDEFVYQVCFEGVNNISTTTDYNATDVPKTLPVEATTIASDIVVSGTGVVSAVSLENIEINHGDIGELSVRLISPSGESITIFDNDCSSYGSLKLNFSDLATQTTITCPPTNYAYYKPVEAFSKFNGESPSGTWSLQMIDNNQTVNAGILDSWRIKVETTEPQSLGCKTASAKILVMPKVVAPIAVDDCAETTINTPIDIEAFINDTDEDNDLNRKSISITVSPSNGNVTMDSEGVINYVPNADYMGTDFITYSICDLTDLCATAQIKINISTILAVNFTDFSVKKEDNQVHLGWNITEGHTADYFVIERNIGSGFVDIGATQATSTELHYEYHDTDSDLNGTILYRIKTIEIDGTISYTDIESINISDHIKLSVYPNPFTEYITVDLGNTSKSSTVSIYDVNGNILTSTIVENKKSIFLDNMDAPSGIYLLKIRSENGAEKMIKLLRN